MPEVLKHVGPYINHEPFKVFAGISERSFEALREFRGGGARSGETPTEHLWTRMLYISETTSTAIRLNASWALSLPSMSLARDRYEQTVRFSWLARQPTNTELAKYIGYYYAKANSIYQNTSSTEMAELAKMGVEFPDWQKEKPTRELRQRLERWQSLDLLSMAKKRDEMQPLGQTRLAKQTLADLYSSVYRQFSSVSHFDMYSMGMVGLFPAPSGELVLAPDPWWPSFLCAYTALFDLVQCY